MEVLSLFPRYLLKGELEPALLESLQRMASDVLAHPEKAPDASA